MIGWNIYTGPNEPGYTEQVYFMKLFADSDLRTQAMLRAADRKSGALLSFSVRELPYMTLWKNEAPSKSGYVTGLEPSTSYPFARPIERAAGRLHKLQGGESYKSKVTIRALVSEEEVQNADNEIHQMQQSLPEIVRVPFQHVDRKHESLDEASC
jgi:hypothetical protein